MTEPLFLTATPAAKYLGCSREELIAWIKPDRRLPGDVGPGSGARLWLQQTLAAAKSSVAAWRERDRAAAAARTAELAAKEVAAKARRKGMRKGGAVTTKKVCELLGCSRTELNRWAADGRLPPDGEIVIPSGILPKKVNARAWLPDTIAAAKTLLESWRAQDRTQAREFTVRRTVSFDKMRRHIEDLLAPHMADPNNPIQVCWNRRVSRVRVIRDLDSTVCEIQLAPIRSEISYATALHEIGHMLGRYQRSRSQMVRERWAWEWARRNALCWTPAMEHDASRALRDCSKS